MKKYIYQQTNWPEFEWNASALQNLLSTTHQRLGRLLGRMEAIGLTLQDEAILRTLTLDIVKNSEIENEKLNTDQVRSSIAQRLGLDIGTLIPTDRNVDGIVEITLDAIQHFNKPLTKQRLLDWHAALFPTGRSGIRRIQVGSWRNDENGPMQVVSGPIGRERVHFEAPPADQIDSEMEKFLSWFNSTQPLDPILKAAIAHLWFITIHPFEDGNGRIARIITDLQLARAENNSQRFYSMSAQIRKERNNYYLILEKIQKSNLDITNWLIWFADCLDNALMATEKTLADVIARAKFWEIHRLDSFNSRQKLILNKLLDNFIGKLTSSKWAKIAKCSQDTALRDIQNLIDRKILIKDNAGGRSTSYSLSEISKN